MPIATTQSIPSHRDACRKRTEVDSGHVGHHTSKINNASSSTRRQMTSQSETARQYGVHLYTRQMTSAEYACTKQAKAKTWQNVPLLPYEIRYNVNILSTCQCLSKMLINVTCRQPCHLTKVIDMLNATCSTQKYCALHTLNNYSQCFLP